MMIVVAGPPGSGKTTWISEFIAQAPREVLYLAPGTEGVPLDAAYLSCQSDRIQVAMDRDPQEISAQLAQGTPVCIEVGVHLELTQERSNLQTPMHRVAVVPEGLQDTEWHAWADRVVVGNPQSTPIANVEIWRAMLTGQVVDPPSLDVFWYELVEGAYGEVKRAKGIFNQPDGSVFYFDFLSGRGESEISQLHEAQRLAGRPEFVSGIEAIGVGLNTTAIAQTLQECCLSDTAIAHYQDQLAAMEA
ncbi:GTP-binding protein [Desertifilum sp. FACHB-1129]|uniref:GTPase, G3E family protein n=1 Tax=Desertifilum tharense IPPAS B-1220 TaxID=1781255 RepID=A0A1E5QQX3_9CYAN|nr:MULTISPECIES: hypothetical protein [Desertifilum]MDA0212567.1 GTP-binding protein [Cyanobacteria bacterium FC1]MBD2314541.1 GTP-binding protein [Desertifilum sp. FACHB-1129]MBD2321783.1 GTP-binding protein [Desertifilum sp. FACHB-866]MBD2331910.1 GTP-binding protein [Desertifilum sp. FACHB-868]OEJ76733.1 hypothetical protein BH720_02940 [Desertifilum tharense IPPAS B-1220]